MARKQLECRVIITNKNDKFDMGMYDPLNERYAPLGTYPVKDKDKIVRGLKDKIEMEGHIVTFSEISDKR